MRQKKRRIFHACAKQIDGQTITLLHTKVLQKVHQKLFYFFCSVDLKSYIGADCKEFSQFHHVKEGLFIQYIYLKCGLEKMTEKCQVVKAKVQK